MSSREEIIEDYGAVLNTLLEEQNLQSYNKLIK